MGDKWRAFINPVLLLKDTLGLLNSKFCNRNILASKAYFVDDGSSSKQYRIAWNLCIYEVDISWNQLTFKYLYLSSCSNGFNQIILLCDGFDFAVKIVGEKIADIDCEKAECEQEKTVE